MSRIGEEQLRLLIMLGSPTVTLISGPSRVTRTLLARGLLHADRRGGITITPAGLRALADAMAARRVAPVLAAMHREARAQARKIAGNKSAP